MKLSSSIIVVIGLCTLIGCQEKFIQPDLTPPSPPQGLYTETGDEMIVIFWNSSPEIDVAGYNIYGSNSLRGTYQLLGSTTETQFIDKGIVNGRTYYYAVSSFDFNGNESQPSHDIVYETPRPEGYDVVLKDYRTSPDFAGYDFSTYSVGPYDDKYTDIFFESYNGTTYLDVWNDSEIQDVGYTKSLYDIGVAPTDGWSPSKDVRESHA
ncbi:MAG: hypothetical protein HY277_05500 [Ignavibacteriales bacterium]|nr:hypothetical protein [Ignavibacteriales bacterium]